MGSDVLPNALIQYALSSVAFDVLLLDARIVSLVLPRSGIAIHGHTPSGNLRGKGGT